jgi:hypothetical protein
MNIMKMNYDRLKELVIDLLVSIDDNCYEHSEKLNVIKGSGITADELKLLGFDYINTWLGDAGMDDWDEEEEIERLYHDASENELRKMGAFDNLHDDEEYIPSSENGDYSPSDPWNAPGMKMSDFI